MVFLEPRGEGFSKTVARVFIGTAAWQGRALPDLPRVLWGEASDYGENILLPAVLN